MTTHENCYDPWQTNTYDRARFQGWLANLSRFKARHPHLPVLAQDVFVEVFRPTSNIRWIEAFIRFENALRMLTMRRTTFNGTLVVTLERTPSSEEILGLAEAHSEAELIFDDRTGAIDAAVSVQTSVLERGIKLFTRPSSPPFDYDPAECCERFIARAAQQGPLHRLLLA